MASTTKKAATKKVDPIKELEKAVAAARKAGLVVAVNIAQTNDEGCTVEKSL